MSLKFRLIYQRLQEVLDTGYAVLERKKERLKGLQLCQVETKKRITWLSHIC